jgi:nitrous oxide reductase accessory protein NosL
MKRTLATLCVLLLMASPVWADSDKPAKLTEKDKCPVCGMFVYKYPDWVGEIRFKDGSVAFFDGAKDLFKYYFNLKQYNPNKTRTDIDLIYVTEYYDMKRIRAHDAFFVMGSDVYGPMGRELIPFSSESDAKGFMADHKGKRILRFQDVTPSVLEKLD